MEVKKIIVKPYYKYKQEAYNNLNKLGKSLLREFGFYKQYPEYSEDDLIIYHDPSSRSGTVSFCFSKDDMDNRLWLFTLEPNFCVRKVSFLEGRDRLTVEESQIISKNVMACFKTGSNSTVVKKLGSVIIYWYLGKDKCYFRSVNGTTYINKD